MKRIIKILLRLIILVLTLVIITLFGYYFNISRDWENYYSEKELKLFADRINRSPNLSNNFYALYDKVLDNDRHKSINSSFVDMFSRLITRKGNIRLSSWHVKACYFLPINEEVHKYPYLKLGYGLEKFVSSEKCFDYAINSLGKLLIDHDSNYQNMCLIKDSTAILKFLIRVKAPSQYKRHPELLELENIELMKELRK